MGNDRILDGVAIKKFLVTKMPGYEFLFETREKINYSHNFVTVFKNKNSTIAPTFDVDKLIKENDLSTPEEVADVIAKSYSDWSKSKSDKNSSDDTLELVNLIKNNREWVLGNIFPVLVNSYKNQELINNHVSIPVAGDITALFKIAYKEASCKISHNLFKHLDISMSELKRRAIENIERELAVIDVCGMTAVTVRSRIHGAATVLCSDVLDQIAPPYGLLVIPSSIHEIIVLPYDEECVDTITDMIHEVNHEVLSEEEFLSDYPYLYKDGKITLLSKTMAAAM